MGRKLGIGTALGTILGAVLGICRPSDNAGAGLAIGVIAGALLGGMLGGACGARRPSYAVALRSVRPTPCPSPKLDELGHRLEVARPRALDAARRRGGEDAVGRRREARRGDVDARRHVPRDGDRPARSATGSRPPRARRSTRMQQAALRELERAVHQHDVPPDRLRPPPDRRPRCAASSCGASCAPRATGPASCPRSRASSRLVREEAALRAAVLSLDPYDALMEQYDPGNRAADIAPVFATLKTFLKDFVPEALARQEEKLAKTPLKPLNAPFPIDKQKRARPRDDGSARLRLRRTAGSTSRTTRSAAACPTDVRMTTRYSTVGFPLRADGHPARDRPRPLRAGPAEGVVALAARQGPRHGDPREPEPVRRKADRAQPRVLGMGHAARARRISATRRIDGWDARRCPRPRPPDQARPDPRRCRRGDLPAPRHPPLRDRAGAGRGHARGRRTCPRPGTR